MRIFPLSNWTELDIWEYILYQNIPVVPLYFAKKRPIVKRNNLLLMVDDERFMLEQKEEILNEVVRFRTLGCYPLTGAIESNASNVPDIILEILRSKQTERQGRAIDGDANASMEKKKQEGYF
jgi:sulfate adenylyltransferase subunit 2